MLVVTWYLPIGGRVWSLKDKSQLLILAREEGALPTSIAWLTGEGSQARKEKNYFIT